MSEKVNQILNLLNENEEVASAFEKAESVEAAVALLNQHGVTITADEFAQCAKEFEDGEMSEEMLDTVSGGIILKRPWDLVNPAKKLKELKEWLWRLTH